MATQAEIAEHLFLSDRSIRELISKGVLPAARKSELNVDRCREPYILHLRNTAAGRAGLLDAPADDEGLDLDAERAALAREQRDHYALKNASLRRELLPHGEITLAVTAAFTHVRDGLLSLAGRLAGPLARLTDEAAVRERLADAIGATLAELSEVRVIPSEGGVDA